MNKQSGINEIVFAIVGELNKHGIDQTSYTLQDYIDVDALGELVASESADLVVRITIEGILLQISQDGVQTLN